MRICLSVCVLLLAMLPLWGNGLPEPAPLLGLSWGMSQKEVEDVLVQDDNLVPHGTYLVMQSGSHEYYSRRYGTYLLVSIPMDLVCGFDKDYTALEMISLRYAAVNFNHALAVYEKLADYLSLKLLGTGADRTLRDRERRSSRQDLAIGWEFPQTRFSMRVWGSAANGQVSILLEKSGGGQEE